MNKEKVVAVCSGGFDSIVMLNDLARNPTYEVHTLFFNYGQKNEVQEENYVRYWVARLGIYENSLAITLPNFSWSSTSMTGNSEVIDYSDIKSQYVPMRNMIFASYALSYAESVKAGKVFIALLGGGTYPDTTTDFIFSLNEIAGDIGVEVITPFISHDKYYLLSRAIEYGVIDPVKRICNFFSCNTPVNNNPCGKCPDCISIQEMLNKPLDDCNVL